MFFETMVLKALPLHDFKKLARLVYPGWRAPYVRLLIINKEYMFTVDADVTYNYIYMFARLDL
jgi:hypothetical protein